MENLVKEVSLKCMERRRNECHEEVTGENNIVYSSSNKINIKKSTDDVCQLLQDEKTLKSILSMQAEISNDHDHGSSKRDNSFEMPLPPTEQLLSERNTRVGGYTLKNNSDSSMTNTDELIHLHHTKRSNSSCHSSFYSVSSELSQSILKSNYVIENLCEAEKILLEDSEKVKVNDKHSLEKEYKGGCNCVIQ